MTKQRTIGYFLTELFIIFIGVSLAFALQNWSENKRNNDATDKILLEIKNGLSADLIDLNLNLKGHKSSLNASKFYANVLRDSIVATDSIFIHYFYLTRDYISIQNRTGYETLKSRGLELVKNDSLRKTIIAIYDFDYEILEKLEEDYTEMQFTNQYYHKIHDKLSPYYYLNDDGYISGIPIPVPIDTQTKKELIQYITRIDINRQYMIGFYEDTVAKVEELIAFIDFNI